MRFWKITSGDLKEISTAVPAFVEKAWSRGRAGFVVGPLRQGITLDWDLWSSACHLQSIINVFDGCFRLSGAVPPVQFAIDLDCEAIKKIPIGKFLALDGRPSSRELSVRCYAEYPPMSSVLDVRIAWRLLTDGDGWSSEWPWWVDRSVGLSDAMRIVFGDVEHTIEVVGVERVFVSLPEGSYRGTVTLTKEHWRRKHGLFVLRTHRGRLEMDEPIPNPGYGDEGLSVLTGDAQTSAQIVARAVESVLHHRQLYRDERQPSDELH